MASSETNAMTTTKSNYPPLFSVIDTLKSILHGLLPDHLGNDPEAFEQHVKTKKERLETERNQWKYGLNYAFETLRLHKEWLSRNQQYVSLKKDEKKMKLHIESLNEMIARFISRANMEKGLREATVQGRVGAYTVLYELRQLAVECSRANVKLETLQASDTSMSFFCNAFTIEIILADGQGTVKSASLSTTQNGSSTQYPERDKDLKLAVIAFAQGDKSSLKTKISHLISRAELALKHTQTDLEEMEAKAFKSVQAACMDHPHLSARRIVGGIEIEFDDDKLIPPIGEIRETKYRALMSPFEWNATLCFKFSASIPLRLCIEKSQELAIVLFGSDQEKSMQTLHRLQSVGRATDLLSCINVIAVGDLTPATETTYTRSPKDGSGSIYIKDFPLSTVVVGDTAKLRKTLWILGQAIYFDSLVQSCFSGPVVSFGQRNNEPKYPVGITIDVASQPVINLRTDVCVPGSVLCISLEVGEDCSITADLVFEDPKPNDDTQLPCSKDIASQIFAECHALPVAVHFILIDTLKQKPIAKEPLEAPTDVMHEGCSLDPEDSIKLEADDILMDTDFDL